MTAIALAATLFLGTPAAVASPDAPVETPEAAPAPVSSAAENAHLYPLGVGDLMRIEVFGEPSLSGAVRVEQDGCIAVQLIKRHCVQGKTTGDIAAELQERLGDGYLINPNVTVTVEEYVSRSVRVLGAVENPHTQYLKGPTTVLDVLTRAGGFEVDTGANEVHLRRDGSTIVLPSEVILSGRRNLMLQDGDVVYVPEPLVVYMSGQVGTPGTLPFSEDLTVTKALTQAGGPTETASLRDAYILRDGATIPINIRRILKGREADVALRPDDQLIIRESVF